jgi:DNA replication protein DnaC
MLLPSSLINRLTELRLLGMREALAQQENQPHTYHEMAFNDRLLLLLEAEQLKRYNHKLSTHLRQARLHECVALDTLDFSASRGLSKSMCLELAKSHWVKQPQNILIMGATGTGKTYLACALAHQACANLYTGRYYRLPRLLHDLQLAEHNGNLPKLLQSLAKCDVLILDDWGLTPLTDKQRRHLLEVLDDRYHYRATIITSQLPVKHWHAYIDEPTLADAILDRLIHGAQQIALKGESLRKKKEQNNPDNHSESLVEPLTINE